MVNWPSKRALLLSAGASSLVLALASIVYYAHRAATRLARLETEARINFERGHLAEAEARLEEGLELDPHRTRLVTLLAAVRSALGRTDEAEKLLRAELEHAPEEPRLALALAQSLVAKRGREEAWRIVEPRIPTLEAPAPDRAELLVGAGQVAAASGHDDAAERLLREGARATGDESAASGRALALRMLGKWLALHDRYLEAEKQLAEAQLVAPQDLSIATDRALVLEKLGRRADGIALLRAGPIAVPGPHRFEAVSAFADLLVRAGELREARQLAETIGRDPAMFALASYVTGSVAFATADFVDAEEAFGRLAGSFPTLAWTHLVRARAAVLAGNADRAREAYAAAERLQPGLLDAELGLLRLDERAGARDAVVPRALELLSERSARAAALMALVARPPTPDERRVLRGRLDSLATSHPDDLWLHFFAAVLRMLDGDVAALADLQALSGKGRELEAAFAPQSRFDLASIDRIEVVEWTAIAAQRERALAPARSVLASIYMRLGRNDLARLVIEGALADEPGRVENLVLWARLAPTDVEARRVAESLDELVRDRGDSRSLLALADLRERLGEPEKARRTLERALAATPDDPAVHVRRAFLDASAGDLESAIVSLEEARRLAPRLAAAHLGGALLLARGDLAGAESRFRAALEATTDRRFAGALAGTLALEGRPREALQPLAAWAAALPGSPEAPLIEAVIESLAGDPAARETVQRAGRACPEEVRAAAASAAAVQIRSAIEIFVCGLLGWTPGQRQRLERVARDADAGPLEVWLAQRALGPGDPVDLRLALARRMTERAPSSPSPWLDRAVAELAAGDRAAAQATARELEQRFPKDAVVAERAAMIFDQTGSVTEALTRYERLAQSHPSAVVENNIAWLVGQDAGRRDVAIAYAREAVRLDPNLASSCDTLGWLTFQSGQLAEAELMLVRAVALAPESPGIRYRLALVFEARHDPRRSIHHATIALRAPRDFSERPAALALIARLETGSGEEHR